MWVRLKAETVVDGRFRGWVRVLCGQRVYWGAAENKQADWRLESVRFVTGAQQHKKATHVDCRVFSNLALITGFTYLLTY